jgi:hypothetical protein
MRGAQSLVVVWAAFGAATGLVADLLTPHPLASGVYGAIAGAAAGAALVPLTRRPPIARAVALGVGVSLAILAVMALAVVAAVALEHLWPVPGFGLAALAVAGFGRRAAGRATLEAALEGAQSHPDAARRHLARLAVASWAREADRAQAALHLGTLEAARADAIAARAAWVRVRAPRLRPHAAVRLAWLEATQGDSEAAQTHLAAALAARDRRVRAQADAPRLLLTWRREGEAAAQALAARLGHGPHAPLTHAVLAALARATGQPQAARAHLQAAGPALGNDPLGALWPELAALRAWDLADGLADDDDGP